MERTILHIRFLNIGDPRERVQRYSIVYIVLAINAIRIFFFCTSACYIIYACERQRGDIKINIGWHPRSGRMGI